jgi:hypothetical protein
MASVRNRSRTTPDSTPRRAVDPTTMVPSPTQRPAVSPRSGNAMSSRSKEDNYNDPAGEEAE